MKHAAWVFAVVWGIMDWEKRKNLDGEGGDYRATEKGNRREGVEEDLYGEALVAAAMQPHHHL